MSDPMDIEQALLEQIRSLTPQQQQEILNLAEFLHLKVPIAVPERVPGLYQGTPYWIADDFDALLSGQFWLGEA